MKKEVIAHKDPKSQVSEVFRTLRTNIQFMNTSKKLQTILITSTLPGEGKSYVTINLAVTFAQTGKRVLLMDADMRKGRQYVILDASPKPGLSNYLSGVNYENEQDLSKYVQKTEVENLYFLPSGDVPPNPSELLISHNMTELLEKVKTIFDVIIIDGTPSEVVTDSVILSRLADTTVIVTECKKTKKDNLKQIIKNIQNVGGKIAGVVMNKVPISASKYEVSYYYGSNKKSSRSRRNNKHAKNQNYSTKETKFEKDENKDNISKEVKNIGNKKDDEMGFSEGAKDILNQINDYLYDEKNKEK